MGTNTVTSVKTSFSIPIMEAGELEKFIVESNLNRFLVLKVKVNRENADDLCREVLKTYQSPVAG